MKTIEDLLRAAAASGNLNHISIASTANGGWEAAYRGVATADHRIFQHADVVCALRGAMTGRPGDPPPKRRKAAPPPPPPADDEDLLV